MQKSEIENPIEQVQRDLIPEIKYEFYQIVKKVNFLYKKKEDRMKRYTEIISVKLEEIEEEIIGSLWVAANCPNIHSNSGQSWLIKANERLSSSNIYLDYQEELQAELKGFILKYEVLSSLRGRKLKIEGEENLVRGYASSLSNPELEALFNRLNAKYFESSLKSFKAMLSDNYFPSYYDKPAWLLTYGINPHKGALREFLGLAGCRDFKKNEILDLIVDKKGEPIKLAACKKDPETNENEKSNELRDLENIFKSIKTSAP